MKRFLLGASKYTKNFGRFPTFSCLLVKMHFNNRKFLDFIQTLQKQSINEEVSLMPETSLLEFFSHRAKISLCNAI